MVLVHGNGPDHVGQLGIHLAAHGFDGDPAAYIAVIRRKNASVTQLYIISPVQALEGPLAVVREDFPVLIFGGGVAFGNDAPLPKLGGGQNLPGGLAPGAVGVPFKNAIAGGRGGVKGPGIGEENGKAVGVNLISRLRKGVNRQMASLFRHLEDAVQNQSRPIPVADGGFLPR